MTKELSYTVRAEPVEAFFIEAKATLRQAQGERMIVNE